MAAMTQTPVARVRGLRVEMPQGGDIVDDVSFDLMPGEVIGLVGESGSGKTTVGMALLGYARGGARITAGSVTITGKGGAPVDVLALDEAGLRANRGLTVAYVPQDPASALNPGLRVGFQIAEAVLAHEPACPAEAVKGRVRAILREVGLPDTPAFLARYPHQMSGGQQQRIGIAMAFVLQPRVIVLDEPTTGLDVTTQNRVLAIIRRLCRDHGVGALHVTHDLSVIATLADRILVMYSGRVVEFGTVEQVFSTPNHPYTQALLSAVPELRHRTQLRVIAGHPARPGERPQGCFFAPRCAIAQPDCLAALPPMTGPAGGHQTRCLRAGIHATEEPEVMPDPAPSAAPVVFAVQGLGFAYGRNVKVLHDVGFAVRQGECVALVGESGSGKSTLSRSLIGLLPAPRDTILYQGRPLAPLAQNRTLQQRRAIQYVFQSPHNSLNPRKTVAQILGLVFDCFNPRDAQARHQASLQALRQVGLPSGAMVLYPDQMSGGERQRVAIARALMSTPEVLICDEVTSALDVSVQAAIINLLKDLQRERGLTLLFVTHDLALVRNIADRVLVLDRGHVAELGPVAQVIDQPQAAFTRQLVENARLADLGWRVGSGEAA